MSKRLALRAVAMLCLSGIIASMAGALAQRRGTAAEAKAMLMRTAAALKANETNTLAAINNGEHEFLDGDLYAYCFRLSDGIVVAMGNPNPLQKSVLGRDIRTLTENGRAYGQEEYNAAQGRDGEMNEVSYMTYKIEGGKLYRKTSFLTRVGELGCGVGYYH